MESLYYDACLVINTIITVVLTYKDFGSAFLPMLWMLGPYISRYIILPAIKFDNTQGWLMEEYVRNFVH